MEALQATPQTIQELFTKSYIIPEFQRPYSWERQHCEQLWEDLLAFYASDRSQSERYFLGTIVLYEDKDDHRRRYSIIDGQQRVITLSLLMRAVFEKVQTYDKLAR